MDVFLDFFSGQKYPKKSRFFYVVKVKKNIPEKYPEKNPEKNRKKYSKKYPDFFLGICLDWVQIMLSHLEFL